MRLPSMLADLQFALRMARKAPGATLAAAGMLAVGIGANGVIFSVVSGVMLRPLPLAEPQRVVEAPGPVHYRDIERWRARGRPFESVAAFGNIGRNLEEGSEPERIQAAWGERGLFRTLGAEAVLGRTFREDDPLTVAVIGAGLWRRRFGGDPAMIGRKILLDREPYTVIGVMPDSFRFPYHGRGTELWIPWERPPGSGASPDFRVDFVAARLSPGVNLETAQREIGTAARIRPVSEGRAGKSRPALLALSGAVALVLLIACANVANLLLARAVDRRHEIAIRAALGAGRARLFRQLLTESLLLGLTGGLAGLAIAGAGTSLLRKLAAAEIPPFWEIGIDWRVAAFLAVLSAGTAIVFGLVPALLVSRTAVQPHLQAGARHPSAGRGGMVRDGLVVAEVALALVLLIGAGSLLRAFLGLMAAPTGMSPDRVLTMHLTVKLEDYSAPGSYGRYLQRIRERVRQVPGVRGAGLIQYLPLQNFGWWARFSIEGRPPVPVEQLPTAELRYVTPGYFEAMGIPLQKGRLLTDSDTSDMPTAILVNHALARQYFAGEDAVGRRTDRGTIVGVVGDVKGAALELPPTPEIYYTFAQNTAATSDAGVTLVAAAAAGPEALDGIVAAIHEVNPRQVVFQIRSMRGVMSDSLSHLDLSLRLLGLFAGIAVLLAMAGVYGVVSRAVAARTREFGIRMALGADGGRIFRLVLGRGSLVVGLGLGIGVGGAVALTRVLRSVLHGVEPADSATLAAAGVLLGVAALAACAIPARRAVRIDPNVALKYE